MTDIPDFPDDFEAVLDVLAASVLADHRLKDPELIEFTHCAHTHLQHLYPEQLVCPTEYKAWFNDRKTGIGAKMKAGDPEDYIRTVLAQISDPNLQRQLLTSIFNIAICDYDLADEECRFLQLALDVWDQKPPHPDEFTSYI